MDKGTNGNGSITKGSSGAPVQRPAAFGVLPEDFVLHRTGKGNPGIVSSKAAVEETGADEFDTEVAGDDDFDITVPLDDDFDIEVRFD